MIVLITDYGYQGPYVGQLKAKLAECAPTATVIDLMHDLPAFNISAASSIIPAITHHFPKDSIFICVVDPGVGGPRKPVLIKTQSHYYIGPDNGIFDKLISGQSDMLQSWEILWRNEQISDSFHGRDLFAPVACLLHNKELNFKTELREYEIVTSNPAINLCSQIIYFDNFGNAITSIESDTIDDIKQIELANIKLSYRRVYCEAGLTECFWYKNSMGLVELACNQNSIQDLYNLNIGQVISIHL